MSFTRLSTCPYGTEKPACARCPVHCCQAEKRAQIRTASPRMILHYPLLAIRHLIDELCKPPQKSRRK